MTTACTRLWLDCEFNEHGGDLLSMALVGDGVEWYAERELPAVIGPWVAVHVVPLLTGVKLPAREFGESLGVFLRQFPAVHVVADWPDDIKYFCSALIVGPGVCVAYPPLTMEIRRDLSSEASSVPHHALYDAWAIMLADTRP